MSDNSNKNSTESPTASTGKKSIDIKFVNESTTPQIHTNDTYNKNEQKEEKKNYKSPAEKQNYQTSARKRINTDKAKELKRNTDEPKVKRSKSAGCENMVRRTSPRKCSGRDFSLNDKERKSTNSILDRKGSSPSKQVVRKSNNLGLNNKANAEKTPTNKKRKREEEKKQNGFSTAPLESTSDKKIIESKSPAKLSKIQGTSGVKRKLTDNNQSIPNNGKDDDPSRMEKGKNDLNGEGWESDSGSDEELMEAALSPSSKNFQFELNDVVWAKLYRDPFWPAKVGS